MTEPRVEAGDRALETARKIHWEETEALAFDRTGPSVKRIAALIQSAMNAQERELREALKEGILLAMLLRTFADLREEVDKYGAARMGAFMRRAEALIGEKCSDILRAVLAERGEGR